MRQIRVFSGSSTAGPPSAAGAGILVGMRRATISPFSYGVPKIAISLSLLWITTVALMPALNSGTRQRASPVRALRHTMLPSPAAEYITRLPSSQPSSGCEKELSFGRSPGLEDQTSSPDFLSKA